VNQDGHRAIFCVFLGGQQFMQNRLRKSTTLTGRRRAHIAGWLRIEPLSSHTALDALRV
jgi:hypothetical protein